MPHLRPPVLLGIGTALLAAVAIPAALLPGLTASPGEPAAAGAWPVESPPVPPSTTPLPPTASVPSPVPHEPPRREGGAQGAPAGTTPAWHRAAPDPAPVTAAALRAGAGRCERISKGAYRTDGAGPAHVAVCGAEGAVFWKAPLTVVCDGQVTVRCNDRADPRFANTTAYTQSNGLPLNAEKLPYIVVPSPSGVWDHRDFGIGGGSVAAVVHGDTVRYAVVGDTGPPGTIGEASYATARGLGVPTTPAGGGGGGAVPDVTFIVFQDAKVSPPEDRAATVRLGEKLARKFLLENGDRGRAGARRVP
ncbi:glycoside hydrolase family 75 protein [Streptomyces sp. NPDC004749]